MGISQRHITARDTLLFQSAEMQSGDPSKMYEIKYENKIGEGGFAKVFKSRRKADDFVCALKFCEPKTDSDRNMVINEIGLMNQCQEENSVLKIFSCYDFKERIWIFLELMDSDLTSVIQEYHKTYSENVVKYILW